LGIPTRDDIKSLDEIFYEKLKNDRHIIEKIDPLVIEKDILNNYSFLFIDPQAKRD
jgi:hypothetical protein